MVPASTGCCILSLILLLACTDSSQIEPVLSVFHQIEASPLSGRGSTVNHFSATGYLVPQWCDVSKSDNIHSRDWAEQRRQCPPTRALSLPKRLCGSIATSSQRWTRPADEWVLFSQHALLRKMRAPRRLRGHFNWPFSTPITLGAVNAAGGEEEWHLLPKTATQRVKERHREGGCRGERQGVPLRWRWWMSGSQHVCIHRGGLLKWHDWQLNLLTPPAPALRLNILLDGHVVIIAHRRYFKPVEDTKASVCLRRSASHIIQQHLKPRLSLCVEKLWWHKGS